MRFRNSCGPRNLEKFNESHGLLLKWSGCGCCWHCCWRWWRWIYCDLKLMKGVGGDEIWWNYITCCTGDVCCFEALVDSCIVKPIFMTPRLGRFPSQFLASCWWLKSGKNQLIGSLGGDFKHLLLFTLTWGDDPILTSIFFRWVGSTTNLAVYFMLYRVFVHPRWCRVHLYFPLLTWRVNSDQLASQQKLPRLIEFARRVFSEFFLSGFCRCFSLRIHTLP